MTTFKEIRLTLSRDDFEFLSFPRIMKMDFGEHFKIIYLKDIVYLIDNQNLQQDERKFPLDYVSYIYGIFTALVSKAEIIHENTIRK